MEIKLKIKDGRLISCGFISMNSGSMNMDVCKFEFADHSDFSWICVFKQGEEAYQQMIINGECVVPQEVLEKAGMLKVGCYGTDESRRISTNWVEFNIEDGAYCEATMPSEPTPDVWESLVMNSLPYIGEDGNWYIYDIYTKNYKNSGMPSCGEKGEKGERGEQGIQGIQGEKGERGEQGIQGIQGEKGEQGIQGIQGEKGEQGIQGEKGEKGDKGDTGSAGLNGKDGYTPQRGIDYWTEEDREAVKSELEDDLNFEERLATTVGNYGNTLKGTASGEVVAISDVSPIEHIMDVKVRSKNIAYDCVYNNTTASSESTVGCYGCLYKGKTYTLSVQTENTGATLKMVTYGRPISLITNSSFVCDGTRKSVTFTMTDDFIKDYRVTWLQLVAGDSSGLCSELQIEEGQEATAYTDCVSDLTNMIVSVYEVESQNGLVEYVPMADGTVEGVLPQYPATGMESNASGVIIDCEYNRDINKAFSELEEKFTNAIISLGGNV